MSRPHAAARLVRFGCCFYCICCLSGIRADPALAQASSSERPFMPANAEWNEPVEPFRIAGNLYYVGASNVSSFLIATPEGLILLDTGFRETVPLIERSIAKLGFRFADIRLLLTLHAHFDHVGGVADVKSRTKARFLASPGDAPLLARGGLDDFAFGDRFYYPPVTPDGLLRDGEPVGLGGTLLTPHFTPGHTKGATSWTMTVRDGDRDYHVVMLSSISTPDYQLVDNPKYPTIVQDFESTFTKLRALPCDIFLTEHGWDSDLPGKMQRRRADPAHNPFVDPEGYRRYIDKADASVHKLAAEQKARQPKPSKQAK